MYILEYSIDYLSHCLAAVFLNERSVVTVYYMNGYRTGAHLKYI